MENYKKRTSESSQPQKKVEYLQNGILIRFNEKTVDREETTAYVCTEFWFSLDSTIQEIEAIAIQYGFDLTNDHKNLIK